MIADRIDRQDSCVLERAMADHIAVAPKLGEVHDIGLPVDPIV